MAGSVNKTILIGNVGKDPDIRTNQSGSRIASFGVATSESWKDKSTGERKENTQWHRVVVFNETLVGVVERFLKKGSKVYVEGQLESRKWSGDDGRENAVTEIVLRPYRGELTLLDKLNSDDAGDRQGDYDRRATANQRNLDAQRPPPAPMNDVLDDDIPF